MVTAVQAYDVTSILTFDNGDFELLRSGVPQGLLIVHPKSGSLSRR
jgi:hypothetical protein